jgi:aromatic ring-opening dioxygenase LigB subunit
VLGSSFTTEEYFMLCRNIKNRTGVKKLSSRVALDYGKVVPLSLFYPEFGE